MASREEILANFQACTGIENVELAISKLEESGWSFTDAVNKAIPPSNESSRLPEPTTASIGTDDDMIPIIDVPSPDLPPISATRIGGISNVMSMADDFYAGPSSSYGPRTRMLEFNVQHGDRMFQLKVPDNEDIKTLKTLIQNETGFPPCQQDLRGFKGNHALFIMDTRKLSELNLPKENVLHLITPSPANDSNGQEEITIGDSGGDFQLTIQDQTHNQVYNLNFRPTQSVLNVKLDTSNVTNIPVSKQVWTGWPKDINDELSLAQLGIPRQHFLTLKHSGESPKNMPEIPSTMSDQESDDEYEDAHEMEDEFFISSQNDTKDRIHPLIPDDYGDEALAGIKFAEEFANRYGSPHPAFFPGSLSDAIKESCMQPAKDRKMLAVYLHHDSSVLTNVFCTQALCAESIVQFLNANFVSFGWDLTHASNKQRVLNMITREFGSVAASTVRNLDIERFPLLALVCKLRGTTEIIQMVHGNVTLDELMSQLLSAHETFASQIVVEVREEEERAARDAVKREQDLAFEMSLQADREKQAQREREEAERKEQERVQEAIRKSEEEARLAEEREKERKRQLILQSLPEEPSDSKNVSKLRFRVPSGENLERRFKADSPLQIVLDFLTVKGFPADEYKVLSSWPRRDLSNIDRTQSLKELNLFPQETLTLEEK